MERKEDGYAPHRPACRMRCLDQLVLRMRPGVRRAGLAKAEPALYAGPAAPCCGAALSTPGMGDRLGVKVPWRKRWC